MSGYYPPGVTDADIDRHFGDSSTEEWPYGGLTCEHDDAWREADNADDEDRLKQLEKSVFEADEVKDLAVFYDRWSATVHFTCALCGTIREQEFEADGEGGFY